MAMFVKPRAKDPPNVHWEPISHMLSLNQMSAFRQRKGVHNQGHLSPGLPVPTEVAKGPASPSTSCAAHLSHIAPLASLLHELSGGRCHVGHLLLRSG